MLVGSRWSGWPFISPHEKRSLGRTESAKDEDDQIVPSFYNYLHYTTLVGQLFRYYESIAHHIKYPDFLKKSPSCSHFPIF